MIIVVAGDNHKVVEAEVEAVVGSEVGQEVEVVVFVEGVAREVEVVVSVEGVAQEVVVVSGEGGDFKEILCNVFKCTLIILLGSSHSVPNRTFYTELTSFLMN